MSEPLEPALALFELLSVAEGIRVGDAMVKRAPVAVLYAGTVHPGKYLVLVGGDVASVEEAALAACETAPRLIDQVLLPDVHPHVVAALRGERRLDGHGEAIGIFETTTVCAALVGADHALKGADVALRDLHVADDLGGKAYCVLQGSVADVEIALDLACASLARPETLIGREVIPRLAEEMLRNLDAAARFTLRVRSA